MKKYFLLLLLVFTSCGDIITKIEKDDIPAHEENTTLTYTIDELSHIQVTIEEAKQDILDCALYLYLQKPLDGINLIGQFEYVHSIIKLTSMDKQLLGHVAAKIRSFRKPEPYKGKGIKFVGEHIRRKAGKSA